MDVNYQKLYAYLVGQVDDAIEMVGNHIVSGNCGYEEMADVGMKLKAALLAAEEMYLNETEAE